MVAPRPVAAAIIIVNTAADNATPGDGDCTLREAINNANSGGDTTGGDCVPGTVGLDQISFTGLGASIISLTAGDLPPMLDEVIKRALDAYHQGRTPTALSALAAIVPLKHQKRGLSSEIIRAML